MTHFVVPSDRFEIAAKKPIESALTITWFDADGARLLPKGLDEFLSSPTSAGRRTKFICPTCKAHAWGKPSLNLICGICEQQMPPANA